MARLRRAPCGAALAFHGEGEFVFAGKGVMPGTGTGFHLRALRELDFSGFPLTMMIATFSCADAFSSAVASRGGKGWGLRLTAVAGADCAWQDIATNSEPRQRKVVQ